MDFAERHDPRPPPPSPALERALQAMGPVRTREPRRALAAVVVASLAYGAAIAWGLGVRADLRSLPLFPFVLYAAACLASFFVLLRCSLVPPRGQVLPAGPTASRAAWSMLSVLVALDVLVAVTTPGVHGTPHGALGLGLESAGWRHLLVAGLPCLLSALGIVTVPIALGLWALRRLLPLGGWRVVLALGGAAGALAGLVLHLHCPMTDPMHVTLIHGAALVAPAVILAVSLATGSLSYRPNPDKREAGKGHGS